MLAAAKMAMARAKRASVVAPPAVPSIRSTAFGTSTATMPTHVAGDMLVVASFRNNGTAPGAHSGWTSIESAGLNSVSHTVSYKIAASSSETTPASTNAQYTAIAVIKDVASLGNFVGENETSTSSVSYSSMTLTDLTGKSILVLISWDNSNTTTLENPPAGLTFVNGAAPDAGGEMAIFDSGGARTTDWGGDTVALGSNARKSYLMLEVTGA